ncbi:putative 60S ribosomal protein L28e [Fulvia fulva]|uniref:60S ribosomal protein L28e n=1 Tax=Passalora fulva TaxID=5499 RepID=A0A9Q8PB43_PASFU|nr:putative 60S ribosomal protein L28e [Fulvia fulva]KAK4622036.1 putative 60S ribosomal protein L28e [Fulvia fulva]KAK4622696.1 putative 60S ribosomal protein L28e [Fulvia fulva]UJO19198.1 putative 60S ribosomal protein L28e [Fulvia fulva]WPV16615.1 putative 60S ribosomal protein L28e [Fulvia fulva]WPV31608.1 putative 60S ribosomal protein L28e [Fulvia fulva]
MAIGGENISNDLIWEITRGNNAFLVKRKQAGGVQFSRDPLNLVNKHSRKYEGYVNAQAIGIQPDSNTITLTTKTSSANKPAKLYQTSSFNASTPTRKLYKSVVNSTAKKGYRSDLRAEAVARASAVRSSQREKKQRSTETKLRGAKARKAEESS